MAPKRTLLLDSFKNFNHEACRGKQNVCIRGEQCKKFDEGKELGDRELQARVEKKDEERQRRETLTQVEKETKKQRLRDESRE